jgi:hypothetical protein
MAWRILDLSLLLRLFVIKSKAYAELIQDTITKHGSTLKLLINHDEIAAGNVLRSDNRRKFTPFYCAFDEFQTALQCEFCWIPLAVITHDEVSKVLGGMSAVVKYLLRFLMIGDSSLSSQGVVLPLECQTLLLIKLSPLLLDEAAVKASFDCKGAI